MHLKLPEALEDYIQQQAESGLYSSASEFVRELIREHMNQQAEANNRKEAFLRAVQVGDEQLARGEGIPYTPEIFHGIAREASENVKNGTFTDSQEATPL
jgi:antitoxin ParD1/3/4